MTKQTLPDRPLRQESVRLLFYCLSLSENSENGGVFMENWVALQISHTEFDTFKRFGTPVSIPHGIVVPFGGVRLVSSETGEEVLAYFDPNNQEAQPLTKNRPISQLKPANKDLTLLYEHLQNPEVLIVIVDGFFGTGKTSTVMAHAIRHLKDDTGFVLSLSKPHVPAGRSHGHLPGTLKEKTDPEFESFYQYIPRFSKFTKEDLEMQGRLKLLTLEYARGRDLENEWLVVDEAQNLTNHEAVTLASRVGKGSKLILMGDSSPWQKDIRQSENGLQFLIDLLQGENIVGITELRTKEHVLRGKVAKTLIKALTKKGLV